MPVTTLSSCSTLLHAVQSCATPTWWGCLYNKVQGLPEAGVLAGSCRAACAGAVFELGACAGPARAVKRNCPSCLMATSMLLPQASKTSPIVCAAKLGQQPFTLIHLAC